MAMPFKPSQLGYGGTTRASPFRRPKSPASPSTLRQTTPSASPARQGLSDSGPKFASSPATTPTPEIRTLRRHATVVDAPEDEDEEDILPPPPIPHRSAVTNTAAHGSALSQLQPSQVRSLREGFQILDRDSDGSVNKEDVADMLKQLGLPSSASDVSQFFPPSGPQTMTIAMFLNSISAVLAALSPSSELLSAFSAFDDDDSGQVDLAELRDALLNTAPEPGQRPLMAMDVDKVIAGFTGRRAFTKNTAGGGLGKRGEVFRYHDFVNTIIGGNGGAEQDSEDPEDA